MSNQKQAQFRRAVAEGRLLRAVRETPGARPDTITGSVQVMEVEKDGRPSVLITRTEATHITPEDWARISKELHLDTNPMTEPAPQDFTGPGYEAHPGHDHEDCCK